MPVLISTSPANSAAAPTACGSSEKTLDWDSSRVVLRVIAGPHQGLEFIYNQHDTLLAGRGSQAQLRLQEDRHFSRNHFRLEVNPPRCYLMDLRSRNGTYVNGDRVTECFLNDGDVVSGGRTQMKVSIEATLAEGDLVAASFAYEGTHKGVYYGFEPTGKTLRFTSCDIFRVADGRIVEHWGMGDIAGIIAQLKG